MNQGAGETVKTEPAKADPPRQTGRTAVAAATTTPAAATSSVPAATVALAPSPVEPAQRSVFQRVIGAVGFGGGDATAESGKVQEIAPQRVNVPLPPRRQAATGQAPGPQASVRGLSDIVGDTQRLSPAGLVSGFSKLQ